MAKLQAPAWCENAVPTQNGWEDPITGELYASGGFTQAQIDEFYGNLHVQAEAEWNQLNEVPTSTVETLIEAPVHEKSLEEMSKIELEALGRQHGIELDRRKNKTTLISRVMGVLKD